MRACARMQEMAPVVGSCCKECTDLIQSDSPLWHGAVAYQRSRPLRCLLSQSCAAPARTLTNPYTFRHIPTHTPTRTHIHTHIQPHPHTHTTHNTQHITHNTQPYRHRHRHIDTDTDTDTNKHTHTQTHTHYMCTQTYTNTLTHATETKKKSYFR